MIVKTKNENFEGVRHGVKFSKGVAVVPDKKLADRLKQDFGYEVIDDSKPDDKKDPDKDKK